MLLVSREQDRSPLRRMLSKCWHEHIALRKTAGMAFPGVKSQLDATILFSRRERHLRHLIVLETSLTLFYSTNVGAQLQWSGTTWAQLSADQDAPLWMPWLASRPGVEHFPAEGPRNCRVIVFNCMSYTTPRLRILSIDEDRRAALAQDSEPFVDRLHVTC